MVLWGFALDEYDVTRLVFSKPHTGMTKGLRCGTQFGVPVREEELVTECVGMRSDADQVK